MPAYVGEQVFYDLYLNTQDFRIVLSPQEIGPSLREVTNRADRALLPDPRRSALLQEFNEPAAFNYRYYYPYTAAQMRSQFYALPNWEYYLFICKAVHDDDLMLSASIEIARRYPLYVLDYTARNAWVLLRAPGGKHSRGNTLPFNYDSPWFPFDRHEHAELPNNLNNDSPAIKELLLYDRPFRPAWLEGFVAVLSSVWPVIFTTTRDVSFYLVLSALILVCIKPVLRNAWIDAAVPNAATATFVAAAIVFIEGVAITSMFAEPDIRYYYMMLGLRFIVAGLGAGMIFNLICYLGRRLPASQHSVFSHFTMPQVPGGAKLCTIVIAVYAAGGIALWLLYMVRACAL
jgi:hypothetical protein